MEELKRMLEERNIEENVVWEGTGKSRNGCSVKRDGGEVKMKFEINLV